MGMGVTPLQGPRSAVRGGAGRPIRKSSLEPRCSRSAVTENRTAVTIPDSARVGEAVRVTIETGWPNGGSEFSRPGRPDPGRPMDSRGSEPYLAPEP